MRRKLTIPEIQDYRLNNIEQRAFDRFNRRLLLIEHIHGVKTWVHARCDNTQCKYFYGFKSEEIFKNSYRLSKNQFTCICGRTVYIKITLRSRLHQIEDVCMPYRENFHNLCFFRLAFFEIVLFAIFFYGSFEEFCRLTKYDGAGNDSIDKNWREIILSPEFDILPATVIASIVNHPASLIRKLRNQRPKN